MKFYIVLESKQLVFNVILNSASVLPHQKVEIVHSSLCLDKERNINFDFAVF